MTNINESIKKAIPNLLKWQCDDGHFEGELSSNTFPTCAYTLIQLELGLPIDDELIEWFDRSQKDSGFWGLDTSEGTDENATLFAKLALMEMKEKINDQRLDSILQRIPDLKLNQWLIKIFYARCGRIAWKELIAPKAFSAMMRMGESLLPILPKSLTSRIKPPEKYAPPVRLFYTETFKNLFIAEKHTLVPVFILLEVHSKNRPKVVKELLKWLLDGRCSDGSWFRVGLITALSVMALIDAKKFGYGSKDIDKAIDEGNKWLQSLRSSDGGRREAINLNVWDTALSAVSLGMVGAKEYKAQIGRAVEWLIENQNDDGGWAFSGIPGGNLLSDADDTALAVLACTRYGVNRYHNSIKNGARWLKTHQSAEGGWGTYRPGLGDVSCISITSHVISALLEIGGSSKEIEKAIAWIRTSISDQGYWKDLWLSRNTYGTALAIEALIRTGNARCEEIERSVKWLESCQNSDGGWGEDINGQIVSSTIEQTAWSSYALLLHDLDNASAKRGIDYILDHQNPDGSFDSSCVGIYWEVIGGYADPVYPYVFVMMALDLAKNPKSNSE